MTVTVVFDYYFKQKFKAEDWNFNIDDGMLYLYDSEDMMIGAVKLNKMKYFYVEGWWLITNTKIDEQK